MLQQYFLILKSDNSKYNYLLKSHNIRYYKYYNLISYFDSFDYTKPLIILVPSIFNSPEIWFLPNNDTIVQNILAHCNLYLIEWKQIEQGNFTLDDYVLQISEAIEKLFLWHGCKINLIGHCIGGTLAIAACILKQRYLNELLLITTPWDFSHFQEFAIWCKHYKLFEIILQLEYVPHSFFQIFFFLFSQDCILKKNIQYSKLKTEFQQKKFSAVERWQNSGQDLPIASFFQLLDKFIEKNIAKNNLWLINNYTIKPKLLYSFVTLVLATKDKITPLSSIEALITELPFKQIYNFDTGHLGFLIGSKNIEFNKFLLKWTKNLK